MGKKRKSRASLIAAEDSTDNSSKGTPAGSDNETVTETSPPSKKPKQQEGATSSPDPKAITSSDLCRQFGLKDVELKYTTADYLNLTNYGLFVRMVRPQVQQANPRITSGYMSKLMEAKWREFREGNPLTRKRQEEAERKKREEETKKQEEEARKQEEAKREREQKKGSESEGSSRRSSRGKPQKYTDENSDDDDDGEILISRSHKKKKKAKETSEDEEEEVMPKKKDRNRSRRSGRMDLDSEEENRPRSRSGRSTPARSSARNSPRASVPVSEDTDDSKTEEGSVVDDDDEVKRPKKPRSNLVVKLHQLKNKKQGKKAKRFESDEDDDKDSADASDEGSDPHFSARGRKTAHKPKYVDSSEEEMRSEKKPKKKKVPTATLR